MSVALRKGQGISLEKTTGKPLTQVTVALGWQAKRRGILGAEFDLDSSAFVLDRNDQALDEQWFVFYKNLRSPDGSVLHHGDDLVGGDGEQDNERITINLSRLPREAQKIIVPVTIYDGEKRGQNFGQVSRAFIRVLDESELEVARYDLSDEYSSETGVVFGELNREPNGWYFVPKGDGFPGGLGALCREVGIAVR
jgi:tellurium resistance protein TerD